MKRKIFGLAALLIAITLLFGCAGRGAAEIEDTEADEITPNEKTEQSDDADDEPEVTTEILDDVPMPMARAEYRVATTDELVSAIGSDRDIVLTATEYVLPDDDMLVSSEVFVIGLGNPSLNFAEKGGRVGLTIDGVSNMTIRAENTENFATLLSVTRHMDGLVFNNCSNIVLSDIGIQFDEASVEIWDATVLAFVGCTDVSLENVTLDGADARSGLYASDVTNLRVSGGEIGRALFTIFEAHNVRGAWFTNTLFHSSLGQINLFNVIGCIFNKIEVDACRNEVLFWCDDASRGVQVSESDFRSNDFPMLAVGGAIKFEDNWFNGNNLFERSGDFGFDANGAYIGTRAELVSGDYAAELLRILLDMPDLEFEVEGTEVIDGETAYMIRAYNDMETHIATIGWYYVGCGSACVWEWDLAADVYNEIDVSALLTAEDIYDAYIRSRDWVRGIDILEGTLDDIYIRDVVKLDLDDDGVAELWMSAANEFDEGVSGFYCLDQSGTKVHELMRGDYGATIVTDGTRVELMWETASQEFALAYRVTASGAGGWFEGSTYYRYYDGTLTPIVAIECEINTYGETFTEKYTVDGQEATEDEYIAMLSRFALR